MSYQDWEMYNDMLVKKTGSSRSNTTNRPRTSSNSQTRNTASQDFSEQSLCLLPLIHSTIIPPSPTLTFSMTVTIPPKPLKKPSVSGVENSGI